MADDANETTEALTALTRSLGVEPDAALERADRLTLDDVRRFVAEHVARLLDRNPSLLMHVLYRVDVAERDVQRVFDESGADEIAPRLADLLVERQLQKLRTRRAYAHRTS